MEHNLELSKGKYAFLDPAHHLMGHAVAEGLVLLPYSSPGADAICLWSLYVLYGCGIFSCFQKHAG